MATTNGYCNCQTWININLKRTKKGGRGDNTLSGKSRAISFPREIIMWFWSSCLFSLVFKLSEAPTKTLCSHYFLFDILIEWESSYPGQYSFPICCFSGFLWEPGKTLLPEQNLLSDFLWKRFSFPEARIICLLSWRSPPGGHHLGFRAPLCSKNDGTIERVATTGSSPLSSAEALEKGSLLRTTTKAKLNKWQFQLHKTDFPNNITVKTKTSCEHIQYTHSN